MCRQAIATIMMPRGMRGAIAVLMASLLLAGCGFHMQGTSPLPEGVGKLHVSYHDNYRVGEPPLVNALKQRLRRQHLLGGTNAPARLTIKSLEEGERVVAVSPVGADAAVYEVVVQVVFDYSVNGKPVLKDEKLSTSRNYSVSDTQRLAQEEEKDNLLEQMQQELANLILTRIAIATEQTR